MHSPLLLIADDDPALCRVLEVRCENLGLRAISAHDAMHALIIAHRQLPSIIIMDLAMPAGNGLSASEMLLDDARLGDVPIIIYSATACPEDVRRIRDLGLDFIPKSPDAWPAMRSAILRHLPQIHTGRTIKSRRAEHAAHHSTQPADRS